jgi:GTP cyclohydrolase I
LNNINDLPDVQHSEKPEFPLYINSVGVQNVKAPFFLDSMYGGRHEMVANITMTTDLKPELKGISMSKLTRTLMEYLDRPLKHKLIKEILERFKIEVETNSCNSSIRFDFLLPIQKKSPKSGWVFPQYYKCMFEGRMEGDAFKFFQKVRVQYASYCPCSAALCQHLDENDTSGYPHAQRSFAEVLVEVIPPNIVWLEEIVSLVELSIRTIPYPIIQRPDEQEIARLAAQNPIFVEDAIRKICHNLNAHSQIHDWIIKCTHEESIHTSDAIAISWKGIKDGFDGRKYL